MAYVLYGDIIVGLLLLAATAYLVIRVAALVGKYGPSER